MTLRFISARSAPWWLKAWRMVFPPVRDAYVTVGSRCYMPVLEEGKVPLSVQVHEAVHCEQWHRWGPLFVLGYALPYFRARIEFAAYRAEVGRGFTTADAAADEICSALYLWPWPRRWVRRWFG